MGWSFSWNENFKKADLVAELSDSSRFQAGCQVIKSSVRGNHHWYVLELPDGARQIGLDLMASGGKNEGWGYKSLTESCGPFQYDCPLGFSSSHPTRETKSLLHGARR